MSEQDKQSYAKQDKRKFGVEFSQPERKKFEVLYQPWTPYKRMGSWLQFIWRW